MRWLQIEPMEPTLGGRLFRAWAVFVFLSVAALAGLVTWAFPRQDRLAAEREQRLVDTSGEITRVEVVKRRFKRRAPRYEITVWYSFQAAGEQRIGSRADFSHREVQFDDEAAASAYAAHFPQGSSTTVWYDRDNPADSARSRDYVRVAHLVLPAQAVGALALFIGLVIARRTRAEARARPLPGSEWRRALRMAAGTAFALGLVAALLLAAHVLPWVWHQWRARGLVAGTVYLTGDLEIDYDPPTPRVQYYFRPDPAAAPTVFVDGDAWRFGGPAVASEAEALAITQRIGEDYRAERLRVFFDPHEPTHNALSAQYGTLLSASTALRLALLLAGSGLTAAWLRRAAARIEVGPEQPERARRGARRAGR